MKKVFLTFSDSGMRRSLLRISEQARSLGFYDEIFALDEKNLDAVFVERFASRLTLGSRGYGYWAWKPQIILQTFSFMEEGDVLQYTDAGCHLNKNGLPRLQQYFDAAYASETGVLAFQATPPVSPLEYDGRALLDLSEQKWAKGDLLDYFDVRHRTDILESQSIGAGIIFLRKCESSVALVSRWLSTIESDFSLLNDDPSKSENLIGFVEHRHDQSIFSILCKLVGVHTYSAYEYWYPSKSNVNLPDWEALNAFPVQARRDRDYGVVKNLLLYFKARLSGAVRRLKRLLRS